MFIIRACLPALVGEGVVFKKKREMVRVKPRPALVLEGWWPGRCWLALLSSPCPVHVGEANFPTLKSRQPPPSQYTHVIFLKISFTEI